MVSQTGKIKHKNMNINKVSTSYFSLLYYNYFNVDKWDYDSFVYWEKER